MDSTIEKYKHSGSIALWQFPGSKNYSGWNITLDENGRKSLLDLLKLMSKNQWPSRKLIDLSDPLLMGQDWIKSVGNRVVYNKVLISFRPEENLFLFDDNDSNPKILLGPTKLKELEGMLMKNAFDEGIISSDEVNTLFFW